MCNNETKLDQTIGDHEVYLPDFNVVRRDQSVNGTHGGGVCIVKRVFHFNRTVSKRTVFHCFVNTQAELMIWTQKNTLLFATIRLKWKTAFTFGEI